MNKETLFMNINILFIVILMGFAFSIIGKKNMENVKNIIRICEINNIEYQTHTNWFGNVTEVIVKE